MKIEKLNDHQIRCTLTKDDLASRHIKLSELAYGTEKTRALFHDMMTQASADFGFEVDDIPLMVEAIPLSTEKIILIITKVESPDELDTRFSEFSPFHAEGDAEGVAETLLGTNPETADDLLELLNEIKKGLTNATEKTERGSGVPEEEDHVCLFSFPDASAAIPASQAVAPFYRGNSSLYKDTATEEYLLFLRQGQHSPMEFNRIIHTIAAYLEKRKCSDGIEAYYQEHGQPIIRNDAVRILAEIAD